MIALKPTGDQSPANTVTESPALLLRIDEQDDLTLIAAISQGDNRALEALYDRYSAVVYRMALRIVKNQEQAEDIVQEVFWRVWRRSSSFERERGRVAQWLFGVAHNLCIDELRRMRSRPISVYEDVEHPLIQQLPDERTDVASEAWQSEQRRVITDMLDQLPEAQRQAIEMAYFGGMSHQEIATKLNRPLGTIKTRVRLGLHKLKSLLSARGMQPSDAW
ncbi:MAG TPA: sigma-70 family RNA polymerase sigma factor [Roseiflexaceae bacterium]|nr:sigma-70 family RNA polymerase sigma factor [Roseiflexaceae bacterium]